MREKTTRFGVLVAVLITVLLVATCSSTWQVQARNTVIVLIDSWDLTMTSLGMAYRSGALGSEAEEIKSKAIEWGEVARLALKGAAHAIDASDAATFADQIRAVTQATAALTQLLNRGGVSDGFKDYRSTDSGGDRIAGIQGGYFPARESSWGASGNLEREIDEAGEKQLQLFRHGTGAAAASGSAAASAAAASR